MNAQTHNQSGTRPEQERQALDRQARNDALAPTHSVWLSASAGSGKTHVLIERILALLLDGADPQHLLCITYTRAAAAEMMHRLAARLMLWATDTQKREQEVQHIVGALSQEELAEKFALASRLFFVALDAPGGIRVRTIHAWCQELLRSFPLEAGISPDFELVEENAKYALQRNTRIHSLKATGQSAHFDFLSRYADEEQLNKALTSQEVALTRENTKPSLLITEREEAQDILHNHFAWQNLSVRTLQEFDRQICDGIPEEAERLVKLFLEDSNSRNRNNASKALDWLSQASDQRTDNYDAWIHFFLTATGTPRKKFPSQKFYDSLSPENATLVSAFIAGETERILPILTNRQHFLWIGASLALSQEIKQFDSAYRSEKLRQRALDYDDLIQYTRTLLCDAATADWVRYRLDGGLDHLLMDEAQDTNPSQWDITRALIEEFYAGESAYEDLHSERKNLARTFFAVGDYKQSIFSFQGANLADTKDFLTSLEGLAHAGAAHWHTLNLYASYRSAAPILRFVDEVFTQSSAQEFNNLYHFANRTDAAGLVEVAPIIPKPSRKKATKEDGADDAPNANKETDEEAADSPTEMLVSHLAKRIDSWLNPRTTPKPGDEAWLDSKQRPVQAGDIMILLPYRKPLLKPLAKALRAKEIEVVEGQGVPLTQRPIVADLVALAQCLLNPDDNLTLARTLKTPFFSFQDEDILELARLARTQVRANPDNGTLYSGALISVLRQSDNPRHLIAIERLSRWQRKAEQLRIYEFFEQVLAEVGQVAIASTIGQSADEDLQEFLAYALEWEEKNRAACLMRFLHALEQRSNTSAPAHAASTENAVRILTIHAAKGLEAPIVVLPQTSVSAGGRGRQGKILWLKNPQDSQNTKDAQDQQSAKKDTLSPAFPLWFVRKAEIPGEVAEDKAYRATEEAELLERERLLYVALTRARDRLYIYATAQRVEGQDSSTDEEEAPDWYGRIEGAVQRLKKEIDFPALPSANEKNALQTAVIKNVVPWGQKSVFRLFCSGKKTEADRQESKPEDAQEKNTLPSWYATEAPADPGGGIQVVAASSLALADSPSDSSGESGTKSRTEKSKDEKAPAPAIAPALRGTLVHALLQYLPDTPADARSERGQTWLASQIPDPVPQSVRDEILNTALAVLQDPACAPLFQNFGLNEVPLLGVVPRAEKSPLFINGRVDRLVVTDEKIIVIDYKSDQNPPQTPQDAPKKYLAQMAAYRRLLQSLYPQQQVEAGLLWTQGANWMPLPDALLDDVLPQLTPADSLVPEEAPAESAPESVVP